MLFEKSEHIATITFNRPEMLNVVNHEVLEELSDVLDQVEQDESLRVLLITGNGKAFVAGADIKSIVDLSVLEAKLFSRKANVILSRMEKLMIPVIAAVNGYALGGGFEIAMACDLRIASDKAVFALPEVKLGIMPGFGGTQRLSRLVGPSIAKEMIFTGRNITADDAKSIGLVNQVCASEDLLTEAKRLANKIAKNAPVGVSQSKLAIDKGLALDISAALDVEIEAFSVCFATEDQKLGMRGFINKEKDIIFKNS